MCPGLWRFVERRLRRAITAPHAAAAIGDLAEDYARQRTALGPIRADLWLLREAYSLARAYREASRERGSRRTWADIPAGLAFAAGRLWRAPAFALAATLLLGVGMAVAAATATLVNVALFKRPAAERGLVHVGLGSTGISLPADAITALLSNPPTSLGDFAGFGTTRRAAAVAGGISRPVAIEAIAGPYFALFDAVPRAGRLIHERDLHDGAMVAVISEQFWRRAFDASPDAVGSTIALAGHHLTITGVVAGPSRSGVATDVWVPAHVLPVDRLFARLAPGVSLDQATAEVAARYGSFTSAGETRTLVVREGLRAPLTRRAYEILALYMAMAVAISLVASLSFGLLLFARMAATQSDMAVRLALGATARDLTRLLAFEVVLLALAATVVATIAGGLLAHFVMSARSSASSVSLGLDITPDWRVVTFVSALTLTMALAVVARLAWRVAEVAALGSMVATGGMGGATTRTADTSFRLVIAQAAATTALLLFAALLARAALPSRTYTHGLDVTGAAIAWIDQTGWDGAPDSGQRRLRPMLTAALEIPGVRHAALISGLPGADASRLHGRVVLAHALRTSANVHYVSAGAFDTFGLAVTQGRGFTVQEDEHGTAVVLVGQSAARAYWPGGDLIGRRLRVVRDRDGSAIDALVIGIVADAELDPGSQRTEPLDVYLPMAFRPEHTTVALLARADQDATVLAERLRTTLQQALPDTAFLSIQSLAQDRYERYAPPSDLIRILSALGALVFVVAIGGLYGLTSYLATMRRREVSVRKALGATTARLCFMLARESSRVLLPGAGIGIALGLCFGSFLVGNTTFRLIDPVAIGSVTGFIYLTGLTCTLAPYLRAMLERNVGLRE